MCGRFAFLASKDDILDFMPGIAINYWPGPRYNIAPSQDIPAVLNDGRREISAARWGLVPSWAKDPALGSRMINARLETVTEKPSFKRPFARQRCVILASGFFEWKSSEGKKIPFFIRQTNGAPLAFAGLFDRWRASDGTVLTTSTIITTAANAAILPVHERMPLMLRPGNIDAWLDPGEAPAEELMKLLETIDAVTLETFPVSTLVNSPAHDAPECIQPVK
jgi:putative SOS response-associated peptidase YedK